MKPPRNLVLRTLLIDPDLDLDLRIEAFDRRLPKNDLFNHYLRVGMQAVRSRHTGQCAAASTRKSAATGKPTAEAPAPDKARKASTTTASKATPKKRAAVKPPSKPKVK